VPAPVSTRSQASYSGPANRPPVRQYSQHVLIPGAARLTKNSGEGSPLTRALTTSHFPAGSLARMARHMSADASTQTARPPYFAKLANV